MLLFCRCSCSNVRGRTDTGGVIDSRRTADLPEINYTEMVEENDPDAPVV
ncbi:MAG: hypothetical protein ACLR5S_04510 [Ruminococcus sp.]